MSEINKIISLLTFLRVLLTYLCLIKFFSQLFVKLMHIKMSSRCLCLLMQQLSIKHFVALSLGKMLLYFFVYLMMMRVLHFNITVSLLRHIMILVDHFLIGSLGLCDLLPCTSVLVMLHYGLFIEFNMVGRTLGPTLFENASSRRA